MKDKLIFSAMMLVGFPLMFVAVYITLKLGVAFVNWEQPEFSLLFEIPNRGIRAFYLVLSIILSLTIKEIK